MPELIPYASRTGTRRNLDALRARGWHLLVSATGVLRTEGFPYAIDNGAWTAHNKGRPIDLRLFWLALVLLGASAEWVALPDIVGGGRTVPRTIVRVAPKGGLLDRARPHSGAGRCRGG